MNEIERKIRRMAEAVGLPVWREGATLHIGRQQEEQGILEVGATVDADDAFGPPQFTLHVPGAKTAMFCLSQDMCLEELEAVVAAAC